MNADGSSVVPPTTRSFIVPDFLLDVDAAETTLLLLISHNLHANRPDLLTPHRDDVRFVEVSRLRVFIGTSSSFVSVQYHVTPGRGYRLPSLQDNGTLPRSHY